MSGFWSEAAAAYESASPAACRRTASPIPCAPPCPCSAHGLIACPGNILKWELFRYGPCSDAVSAAPRPGLSDGRAGRRRHQVDPTLPQDHRHHVAAAGIPAYRRAPHVGGGQPPARGKSSWRRSWGCSSPASSLPRKAQGPASIGSTSPGPSPWRLARMPKRLVPSLRFFHPPAPTTTHAPGGRTRAGQRPARRHQSRQPVPRQDRAAGGQAPRRLPGPGAPSANTPATR